MAKTKRKQIAAPVDIYGFRRITDPDEIGSRYILNDVQFTELRDGNWQAEATDGRAIVAAWWHVDKVEPSIETTPPAATTPWPRMNKVWPKSKRKKTISLRVDALRLIPLLKAMAEVCTNDNGVAPVVLTLSTQSSAMLLTAETPTVKVAGCLNGFVDEGDNARPDGPLFNPREQYDAEAAEEGGK